MATTPDNSRQPKKPRDREQEMLMREVDEAVRTDEALVAAKKWGLPLGIALAVGLAAFGGWLYFKNASETDLEGESETIVTALDEFEAGNDGIADEELAGLSQDASPGARASATMLRAGIALNQGRTDDAVALFQSVADNPDAPGPMRDAAALRAVGANFDDRDPQDVIDRLGPLATADSAWFGSAGEMVAMAYLAQGREDQAGPLLVSIAKDEDVPQSLRARARQMAGVLGFDAIEDVEETLEEIRPQQQAAPAGAPPAANPE